ncbi:MAG: aminopeptidase [Lachnospiraceae bacterium]
MAGKAVWKRRKAGSSERRKCSARQMLVISASVTDCEFVRMCVKAAYEAGAGYVKINWHDER